MADLAREEIGKYGVYERGVKRVDPDRLLSVFGGQ